MEKDRSRGLKHVKDKKKYKGNSTKNPKYVPPKSKPSLDSNWDRYEIPEDNEHEHKLSSSTDFALLSTAPISAGSYFQFKSDKMSEEHGENNLFFLNLDLLHKSILTIPFYERLGMPKIYFEESEIKRMDENAATNLKHFQISQKNIEAHNPSAVILENNLLENLPVDDNTNCLKVRTVENPKDMLDEDDILDLIENCSIDEGHKDLLIPAVTQGGNDDLEQWLDDILEN